MVQNTIFIVGGGKFGKKAVQFAKQENYNIIIIDKDPNCYAVQFAELIIKDIHGLEQNIPKLEKGKILFFQGNVTENMAILNSLNPEYIIPVAPVHFLAELILDYLARESIDVNSDGKRVTQIIQDIKPDILLDSVDSKGVVYLSYAKKDEVCPDNCSAPPDYCPHLKREKPNTITNYLLKFFNAQKGFDLQKQKREIKIIVESTQLRGGLGGIPGSVVQSILTKLEQNFRWMKQKNFKLLIATSCNCHGVINFYKKTS
ncbi:MAG: hypothetical protein R6U96_13545 [Promethearchaeia archaeon]